MLNKEKLISIIIALIVFIFGYLLISDHNHVMKDKVDELSNEIINTQALVLEESIKRTTSSAVILSTHMHTVKGDLDGFEEYAGQLFPLMSGITNLQLAPEGIVTKIYPLKGHEKAIGHNIFKSDARKKEAFLAKKSKKLTLAGPFTLIQGGIAIIARSPIYLDNEASLMKNKKHIHANADIFWGFASTLVLLDDLLKTTELNSLKDKNYLYRLWRFHPDTNKVDVFAGNNNLPNKNTFTKNINVPNGEWYLDIEYVGTSFSMNFMKILYLLNLIISLMVGYFLFIILNRPKELQKEVNLKTNQLLREKLELKKLTNAVTYNSNAIFIANQFGIIEYVNPAFEEMTGYALQDISDGKTDIFQAEISYVIQTKAKWNGQNIYIKKSKEKFVSIITITIIKDSNNDITSCVGVCQDITQKIKDDKIIQEKEILLLQQSKMAAMGEMLGNIAHQWRQPLSVISVSSSGLKLQHNMNMLTDERFVELVDGITKSTKYLSTTIDDFSNFFRPNKEKTKCSTTNLINKTLNILEAQFKNIKIEIVKEIEEIEFITYQNELVQVLINIFNNARDQFDQENIQKNIIFINIYKSKNKLFIKIKDNAKGIEEDIINKIFEPYFTTKDKSVGTGIGLYMSQEIIVKHIKGDFLVRNDEFSYKSEKYRGAEFSIILPLEKN